MSDELEKAAEEYKKGYDDEWMCWVTKPESITKDSFLLNDHEVRMVCACEFEYAFVAGAQWERERAKALVEAMERMVGYESMNEYPEHEIRHTLCVEVPCYAEEALAKYRGEK